MQKKTIWIIISSVIIATLTLLFSFVATQYTSVYEFDWKNLHWQCNGEVSGFDDVDNDISDGSINAKAQHGDCTTRGMIINDNISVSISSSTSSKAGCGSHITCRTTNLNTENVKEIKIPLGASIENSGDGSCSVRMNRVSLSDSMSCPNIPSSQTISRVDVTLIKLDDGWLISDINNQIIGDLNQLQFSVESSIDSGRISASANIHLKDVIITCEEGYSYKENKCIKDDIPIINWKLYGIVGLAVLIIISTIVILIRKKK